MTRSLPHTAFFCATLGLLGLLILRGESALAQAVTDQPDGVQRAIGRVRPGQQPAVAAKPATPAPPASAETLWQRFGLRLVATAANNIIVDGVRPDSPAAKAGLSKGDEVMNIARAPVGSVADAASRLLSITGTDAVTLSLRRSGTRYDTSISLLIGPGAPGFGETNAVATPATEVNLFGMFLHEDPNHVVVIDRVSPLSPAAKAGVVNGDLLVSMAGHPAAPIDKLVVFATGVSNRKQAGAGVPLQLSRNGNPMAIEIFSSDTAAAGAATASSAPQGDIGAMAAQETLLGLVLRDVSPNTVVVGSVSVNSPAAAASLVPGDIVQSVNGTAVYTSAQMMSLLGILPMGAHVDLIVSRNGKAFPAMLPLTPRLQDVAEAGVGIATTQMRGQMKALEDRVQAISDELDMLEKREAAHAGAAGPAASDRK
ncbi:MAG TPA: PDZ domain-containing protein [Pirellulales bacterium]|jgi:S1-C subfamily serine protease|nr:PDZ domain-containing protein [Pirellulales bacterium]